MVEHDKIFLWTDLFQVKLKTISAKCFMTEVEDKAEDATASLKTKILIRTRTVQVCGRGSALVCGLSAQWGFLTLEQNSHCNPELIIGDHQLSDWLVCSHVCPDRNQCIQVTQKCAPYHQW